MKSACNFLPLSWRERPVERIKQAFTLASCLLFLLIMTILVIPICFANNLTLARVDYSALPNWSQGQQQYAIVALKRSCQHALKYAKYRSARRDKRATPAWLNTCRQVISLPNNLPAKQARRFIKKHYTPYRVSSRTGNRTGTFTGYYQPLIKGSLTRTAQYNVPIYGKPRQLTRVRTNGKNTYRLKTKHGYQKMGSRADITAGPLIPNTPIIAWVDSKIDRFFLQIQGSGGIILPNGQLQYIGYNGQNGHQYYPIGRYLIEIGALTKKNVSMQTIRKWLEQHPTQAQRVMNLNPSFVFFRKLNVKQPIGGEGVELTPGRSLAIDHRQFPYGALFWLSTYYPKVANDRITTGKPLIRLMVAQDTGGAIKGAVRGDVFWGNNARAQWLAGHMQSPGKYWLLLPNGVSAK